MRWAISGDRVNYGLTNAWKEMPMEATVKPDHAITRLKGKYECTDLYFCKNPGGVSRAPS